MPPTKFGGRQGEDNATLIKPTIKGLELDAAKEYVYRVETIDNYDVKHTSEVMQLPPQSDNKITLTYSIPSSVTICGGKSSTVFIISEISGDVSEEILITPPIYVKYDSTGAENKTVTDEELEDINAIVKQMEGYMHETESFRNEVVINADNVRTCEESAKAAEESAKAAEEMATSNAINARTSAEKSLTAEENAKKYAEDASASANAANELKNQTELNKNASETSAKESVSAASKAKNYAKSIEDLGNAAEKIIEYEEREYILCEDEPTENVRYSDSLDDFVPCTIYFKTDVNLQPNTQYTIKTNIYFEVCYVAGGIDKIETPSYIGLGVSNNEIIPGSDISVYYDEVNYQYSQFTFTTPKTIDNTGPMYMVWHGDRLMAISSADGEDNIRFTITAKGQFPTLNVYTKEEIDNKLNELDIPETDLSDYYTKSEVDNKLENIDIPETDLSNYYTKGEMDEQIGNIETALDNIIIIQNTLIGGEVE